MFKSFNVLIYSSIGREIHASDAEARSPSLIPLRPMTSCDVVRVSSPWQPSGGSLSPSPPSFASPSDPAVRRTSAGSARRWPARTARPPEQGGKAPCEATGRTGYEVSERRAMITLKVPFLCCATRDTLSSRWRSRCCVAWAMKLAASGPSSLTPNFLPVTSEGAGTGI